ncbi:MAG: hypothetical protein OHK0017_07350 [Patescibacteria group bacterium]
MPATPTDSASKTLEQKLLRLQEIQKLLESGSVNLTDSIGLFEEAAQLRVEIEHELTQIKNKITEIEAKQMTSNIDL